MGKYLARGTTVEVDDGTGMSTLVEIGHILSIAPSEQKTDADLTTYDSAGNAEHQVAQRAKTLTVQAKHDPDDAGQDRMREVGSLIGATSVVDFAVTLPNGDEETFTGSVAVSGPGGGNNDGANVTYTITRSGASTLTEA